LGTDQYIFLNTTDASNTGVGFFGTAPTSTAFTLEADGVSGTFTNASGASYVAYLFAHDTSEDGIIKCGSFTSAVGIESVTLGWEPQYLLYKRANSSGGSWAIADNMRGVPTGSPSTLLNADASAAEVAGLNITFSATGFSMDIGSTGDVWIYLAIRRPNKPPTSGTQVYNAIARTGTGAAATVEVGFAPDSVFAQKRRTVVSSQYAYDKLRGGNLLVVDLTIAEAAISTAVTGYTNTGFTVGTDIDANGSGAAIIQHVFRRAPGFFDVVCYTGTGATQYPINHSLEAVPELGVVKVRNLTGQSWYVFAKQGNDWLGGFLDGSNGLNTTIYNINFADSQQSPTITHFYVRGASTGTGGTYNYVAYLFATLPGISKVGSYTGNGSSQTINCGFTAGARFILIKRTDAPGDWYVWDSARGIVAANDPHLSLNTTAAEVTTDDSVDPDAAGFIVNQVAATNINVTSASYIFLSIA
jgi:hypothetical protein